MHTHRMSSSNEYHSWEQIKQRCTNPKNVNWLRYGGRGIKVCDRWLKFENFYEDMGKKPSLVHTLDRKDSNGNYEPNNCRWATPKEQAVNRKTTKVSMNIAEQVRTDFSTAKEVAIKFGLSLGTVRNIRQGRSWKC